MFLYGVSVTIQNLKYFNLNNNLNNLGILYACLVFLVGEGVLNLYIHVMHNQYQYQIAIR